MSQTIIPVRRALLSVADKTGIVELARALVDAGVEIISSGGTSAAIAAAGLPVTPVEELTGAPEMLGGRVKTLHPLVHGAILADLAVPGHLADLAGRGIEPIQLVVVNLYPFRETVARAGVTHAEAVEQIDIGGPAMIRAAAKNHAWVGVVTDPQRYPEVAGLVAAGGLDATVRRDLAREAFFHTASYDAAIVDWFEDDAAPERMVLPLRRSAELRYGENPHQRAAAFGVGDGWWQQARQLQGKEMSFNNYLDTDAAWRLANAFDEPAVAIVKHANPCGLAVSTQIGDSFEAAWACDPLSAFGGIVALNRPLDADTAARIASAGFVEVVIAPDVIDVGPLGSKANLRVLEAPTPNPLDPDLRRIDGGFLAQERDTVEADRGAWQVVSARAPSADEWRDLAFAWVVCAHTKSNAIVIANAGAAVGVGAGDQSRVGASERAVRRAGERAVGGVAASDAFFPFRDGIDALVAAGVTAVIEPGGSVRDDEVIAAADEAGIALVFTGKRHFKH